MGVYPPWGDRPRTPPWGDRPRTLPPRRIRVFKTLNIFFLRSARVSARYPYIFRILFLVISVDFPGNFHILLPSNSVAFPGNFRILPPENNVEKVLKKKQNIAHFQSFSIFPFLENFQKISRMLPYLEKIWKCAMFCFFPFFSKKNSRFCPQCSYCEKLYSRVAGCCHASFFEAYS